MNKDALRWLTQASDDLGTAQILFDSQRYGPCAFFVSKPRRKASKPYSTMLVSDRGAQRLIVAGSGLRGAED